MNPCRVIAIPTPTTESVRATLKAPRYGHPAHTEVATGYGPCRHCLRAFHIGVEQRILFTYDPFDGLETLPLPGPIFVHAEACERYPEDAGFPKDLRAHPLTLNGYGRGRRLHAQEYVEGEQLDATVDRLFEDLDVSYIHVRDTNAGCYDLRLERADRAPRDERAAL
jgi:hypothetical protein